MVYFPRWMRIFSIFRSQSSVLIPKSASNQKMYRKCLLSNLHIRKVQIRPQTYNNFPRKSLSPKQFEKCSDNYVRTYLAINRGCPESSFFVAHSLWIYRLRMTQQKLSFKISVQKPPPYGGILGWEN